MALEAASTGSGLGSEVAFQPDGFEMLRESEMLKVFNALLRDESGATAIEYGLIAAATGMALVAVMPGLNDEVGANMQSVSDALETAIQ